ncbi:MAG: dual specificity protein phosphatase [Patescibacteria group bacterium]|mgnify:FL=1
MQTGHDHTTDYSQITPNIFLGSDLCKGWNCPSHQKEFEKLHIKTEINVEIEHDEPVLPTLEIYLRIPTPDDTAPTHNQLLLATDALNLTVLSKTVAYVHCKNGHGRSPTVVAAYLIRYQNMDVATAIDFVKEKRPEIHIEKVQIAALEKFADLSYFSPNPQLVFHNVAIEPTEGEGTLEI